jgi:hypothetical protein
MALWLLMALAGPVSAADTQPKRPTCVDVRTEARYRNYGYDHLVTIRNGCDQAVSCDVGTDVSPEPTRVSVAAHAEADVLTFRGSPAREFSARVECRLSP